MRGHLKTPRAKECLICGKTFHATTYHQVCCSDECRAARIKEWHASYLKKWRKSRDNKKKLCQWAKEYRERMKAAQRAVPRLRRAIYDINALVSAAYALGAPRDVSEKLCEASRIAVRALKNA
ncbi:MAG: hypothetical protein IKH04_05335 [Kiritimatiellae bacterium]|nr:hypothetical protein [Kiritimatiellia bacterium]